MGQGLLEFGNPASRLGVTPDAGGGVPDIDIPVKLCNLPPFNAIASRVLSLSADPDIDLRKLAALIECDPAFAADILAIANSPLFGLPSRIQTLREAIAILGLDQINALAVTVAMRGFLRKGGTALRPCWRHSAASAVVASEIAPLFDISAETAFTISLLHDVGRLGLLQTYPREYADLLGAAHETNEAVLEAERAAFHVDHGRAGAWLVKSWAFPLSFVRACEHHHEPLTAGEPPLFQVVKLACRIADALDCAAVRYTNPVSYTALAESLPEGIRARLLTGEAGLRESVANRLKIFV